MRLTKEQRIELGQKYGDKCAYCGIDLGDKWQGHDYLKEKINNPKIINEN